MYYPFLSLPPSVCISLASMIMNNFFANFLLKFSTNVVCVCVFILCNKAVDLEIMHLEQFCHVCPKFSYLCHTEKPPAISEG